MSDPIRVPQMCDTHQGLLVRQAGYKPEDPWRSVIIAAQIALFQGLAADKQFQEQSAGDIKHVEKIGCIACRKPDLFGEVVEAAKTKQLGPIKALGEKWCGL